MQGSFNAQTRKIYLNGGFKLLLTRFLRLSNIHIDLSPFKMFITNIIHNEIINNRLQ